MAPFAVVESLCRAWSLLGRPHTDRMVRTHCFAVVLNHVFRRCVFLPGELRPSTCLRHLRMVVLHHRHAVLWDICLWVCQHVIGYHGNAGERDPRSCWERAQGGLTGRAHFTLASTPTWKHVHTLDLLLLLATQLASLILSNSGCRKSF